MRRQQVLLSFPIFRIIFIVVSLIHSIRVLSVVLLPGGSGGETGNELPDFLHRFHGLRARRPDESVVFSRDGGVFIIGDNARAPLVVFGLGPVNILRYFFEDGAEPVEVFRGTFAGQPL
jgi:hypothetical protein